VLLSPIWSPHRVTHLWGDHSVPLLRFPLSDSELCTHRDVLPLPCFSVPVQQQPGVHCAISQCRRMLTHGQATSAGPVLRCSGAGLSGSKAPVLVARRQICWQGQSCWQGHTHARLITHAAVAAMRHQYAIEAHHATSSHVAFN